MATPAAAAALFNAALPNRPGANSPAPSGSGSNHPVPGGSTRRGRGGPGGAGGRRGGPRRGEEDVGMSDGSEQQQNGINRRKGRAHGGSASNPMGQRPLASRLDARIESINRSSNGPRNAPALVRDGGRSNAPAPKPKQITGSAIDTLRLFLVSRYSAEHRMLNLENMADDPVLKEHGIAPPGSKSAPTNMAGALWKLAAEMFPDVVTLSLAHNHLTSLLPLSPYLLTTSLAKIENVSFASNSLGKLRDLDPFSPAIGKPRGDGRMKGWPNLRELVLTGNPLVETGTREDFYRSEMARRFPDLRTLDQTPIDPSTIAFKTKREPVVVESTGGASPAARRDAAKAKREPIVFPLPIKQGFFESDSTRDFIGSFLLKFFAAFDDDRESLAPAYAPLCTFSFFTDTAHPVRTKAKKIGSHSDKKFPNQHKLDWKMYLTSEGSRNLSRVKNPAKRVATLKLAPEQVIKSIKALPKTSHPLSEGEKFVFDAWTVPGLVGVAPELPEGETVIYAVVQGQFTEFPSKGVRSFSRTFILAPAPPGSPAQLAGWPCIILSDLFAVRGYTDPNVWAPKPDPAAPAAAAAAAPPPGAAAAAPASGQERAEGLTDEQQSIVLQLQGITNLTYAFALLCMQQSAWEPNTAMANFQAAQAAGGLPAEAFRAPV